jgi:hypothetical protein
MTLQVSFEQFPGTVKRLLNQEEAYVSAHDAGALVTSGKPDKGIVVASLTPYTPEVASASLKDLGLAVYEGTWLTPEEILSGAPPTQQAFIASVAYRAAGDKPGLWMDAYPTLPTQLTVLKAMYDEFRATGEVDEVPFEEFVQLANATVVIVSPAEVESFLKQKEEC